MKGETCKILTEQKRNLELFYLALFLVLYQKQETLGKVSNQMYVCMYFLNASQNRCSEHRFLIRQFKACSPQNTEQMVNFMTSTTPVLLTGIWLFDWHDWRAVGLLGVVFCSFCSV